MITFEQILDNYIIKDNCHIWQGKLSPNGYPTTFFKGRQYTVGQLILRSRGESAKFARPICGNRKCINPDHIMGDNSTHIAGSPKRTPKYSRKDILRLASEGLGRDEIISRLKICLSSYYRILKNE